MRNKTLEALCLFNQGELKKALAIFKTFKIGFTKEERRIIEIASDCLNGRLSFYQQLGINVEQALLDSKSIIKSKYQL